MTVSSSSRCPIVRSAEKRARLAIVPEAFGHERTDNAIGRERIRGVSGHDPEVAAGSVEAEPETGGASITGSAVALTLTQDALGELDDSLPEATTETRSPSKPSVNCGHCGAGLAGNPRKRYCRASCRVMACRARKAGGR